MQLEAGSILDRARAGLFSTQLQLNSLLMPISAALAVPQDSEVGSCHNQIPYEFPSQALFISSCHALSSFTPGSACSWHELPCCQMPSIWVVWAQVRIESIGMDYEDQPAMQNCLMPAKVMSPLQSIIQAPLPSQNVIQAPSPLSAMDGFVAAPGKVSKPML